MAWFLGLTVEIVVMIGMVRVIDRTGGGGTMPW